ncbi:unnamed protein product [Linum tenue]|uniref:FYVE-type domain-containing protein n=1 Tax=Linum tenue TaxID=586396 RepID=A0AAV0HBF5_9ROSI|nr:unnamed protein product [Linum tenue]
MHQGDYASYYQFPTFQNPNPNPNQNPPNSIDHHQTASAPPFSPSYPPNDYSAAYPPQSYPPPPPYSSDPAAASYSQPASAPLNSQSSFNPPPAQQPAFQPYDSLGAAYQQQPPAQQSYFPPFDHHQTPGASYAAAPPPPPPASNPIAGAPYVSYSSLNPVGSSVPPVYDNQYENSPKFDHGVGYFDDKYGIYNRGRSDLGMDPYGMRSEGRSEMGRDGGYGDGVIAYQGGKVEPYGARGTAPKSSTWGMFDDYGRAINVPSSKDSSLGSGSGLNSPKIVRAVPKMDTQEDVKSGVQKFRVKLLAESGGQSTMDVLCQIGLDGIKMLDPNTSRTLRIYPLENITRCDKMDSSTFAFWSKSSVDVEPRRIRLQSNSYTTSTLLDTVTAATIQLKEMGGRPKPSDHSKISEQTAERKKGFGDWMNFIKPANEEKDHWVPDEAVMKCTGCGTDFNAFIRRHHCRNCGDIFCDKCTHGRIALTAEENAQPVRVCDRCLAEVTQRLTNTKEAASKPAGLISHEDLAKKLQEEMERNRKTSSGSKSSEGSSGKRMREVACPTCTVHLQVQVPSSGSETIECGVCQHPFLVSAH